MGMEKSGRSKAENREGESRARLQGGLGRRILLTGLVFLLGIGFAAGCSDSGVRGGARPEGLAQEGAGNNQETQAGTDVQSSMGSGEGQQTQATGKWSGDGELEAAAQLGFVLEGAESDGACSQKMFYGLLRQLLSLKGAAPDKAWTLEAAEAEASGQPMLRAYAARALYFTVWQTDYQVDPALAAERGYFEFGATEANACLETPSRDSWILVDNLTDYPEFRDRLMEMDGGWKYEEGKRETIPTDWTISFCIQQMDKNTGRRVMELDPGNRFLPFETISAADAVRAVYRLYRSLERDEPEEAVYINLDEAGTASIPPESYQNNPRGLPDVTQEKFPAWRGAGYSKRFNSRNCQAFSESDLRFLGENGFNYVRLMFGFSTLQGPDYPADNYLVNEKELEKLDELIGWGMKYGLHIQICMHGQPGRHQMENYTDPETGEYIIAENYQSGALYPTEEEWELIGAYWKMLARRYRDIPNRFVTFDLMNEWSVQRDEVERFSRDWGRVIELIREEDPDRVLVASFDNGGCPEAMEALASRQVSLSFHCYNPGRLCHLGASYIQTQYPYLQEAEWPMAYFPCTLEGAGEPLTVRDEAGADRLTLYLSEAEEVSGLEVLADGTPVAALRPEPGRQYGTPFEVELPAGTKELTLSVKGGFVRIGMLKLQGDAWETVLTPHDVFSTGPDKANGVTLLAKGGSFANADGTLYTAADIYQECLLPVHQLASQYGVGFMVNEFGIFGGAFLEGSTATDYFRDMKKMFEEHEIGFAFCEVNGGNYLLNEYNEFGAFRGNADVECIVYEYPGEVFHADTLYVENGLLKALTE